MSAPHPRLRALAPPTGTPSRGPRASAFPAYSKPGMFQGRGVTREMLTPRPSAMVPMGPVSRTAGLSSVTLKKEGLRRRGPLVSQEVGKMV